MSYRGPTCTSCGGAGGHPETTPKPNGGHVSVWRSCSDCSGQGHH